MTAFYSATVVLCMIAMLTMMVSAGRSNTLSHERKKLFRSLFLFICVCACGEWLGVILDGAPAWTRIPHIAAKAVELSMAPSIAFVFSWILEKKWTKVILIYLTIHGILEILSGCWGFIYRVNEDNVYEHASFYWIYLVAYMGSVVYATYIVVRNIKTYQYKGLLVFGMILATLFVGIVIQIYDNNLRVGYLALGFVASMLYIFTLEMVQQTDELTTLLNRRGYENCISHLDKPCVIAFFDVNSFKQANDTYGHRFGDQVLQQVGEILKKSYARYGQCFRYGGDEFCVVLTRRPGEIDTRNHDFFTAMGEARKKEPRLPSVSIGYTYFDPASHNIEDAVAEADAMMYQYKEQAKKAEREAMQL